jgi:hypothetical protein
MTLKQRFGKFFEVPELVENQKLAGMEEWYELQIRKSDAGDEIEPPWVAFPNNSPIYGWNQGFQEAWKTNVWLPFWRSLSEEKQNEYLKKWRPPDDDWRETLTIYWVKNFSNEQEQK